jgi:hypothetical protein
MKTIILKIKNRWSQIVCGTTFSLWFLLMVIMIFIHTSCSSQGTIEEIILAEVECAEAREISSNYLTKNFMNLNEAINTTEDMYEYMVYDIENGTVDPEIGETYLHNLSSVRDMLWEVMYEDYLIHESTPPNEVRE